MRKVVKTAERVSTPARPILASYYIDTSILTGANDWVTYSDSRVLDVHGQQVLYRPCTLPTAVHQGSLFAAWRTLPVGDFLRCQEPKKSASGVKFPL